MDSSKNSLETIKDPSFKIILCFIVSIAAYHSCAIFHIMIVFVIVRAKINATRDPRERSRAIFAAANATLHPFRIMASLCERCEN